ncbi:unnamed protein product [Amoebophrya sp. A25]|nr:unnamed protein product [Amoebophrya sp. A25]|eukprot:GSA25T00011596001.1
MMSERAVDWVQLPSTVANRVHLDSSDVVEGDLDWIKKVKFRETDDLLKQVSKIVSYVLRHGADGEVIPNVVMDEDKQVEVIDLLPICRRCCGISSYNEFVKLLKESNAKKTRYSFHETEDGKLLIKAVHKFEVLPGTNTKIQPVKDTKWMPSNTKYAAKVKAGENDRLRMFQVLRSEHFEMVIVRKGMNLDSDQVGCLQRLEIVELLGEPIVIADGIVRIKIKSIESGTSGWVTQDARQADGPQFLQEITETYWADQNNHSPGSAPASSPSESGGYPYPKGGYKGVGDWNGYGYGGKGSTPSYPSGGWKWEGDDSRSKKGNKGKGYQRNWSGNDWQNDDWSGGKPKGKSKGKSKGSKDGEQPTDGETSASGAAGGEEGAGDETGKGGKGNGSGRKDGKDSKGSKDYGGSKGGKDYGGYGYSKDGKNGKDAGKASPKGGDKGGKGGEYEGGKTGSKGTGKNWEHGGKGGKRNWSSEWY